MAREATRPQGLPQTRLDNGLKVLGYPGHTGLARLEAGVATMTVAGPSKGDGLPEP